MSTQYKTNATDFFNSHPEIRDLLQSNQQAVVIDDEQPDEFIIIAKECLERLIWENYANGKLKEAEEAAGRPGAKKYTAEEFFARAREL